MQVSTPLVYPFNPGSQEVPMLRSVRPSNRDFGLCLKSKRSSPFEPTAPPPTFPALCPLPVFARLEQGTPRQIIEMPGRPLSWSADDGHWVPVPTGSQAFSGKYGKLHNFGEIFGDIRAVLGSSRISGKDGFFESLWILTVKRPDSLRDGASEHHILSKAPNHFVRISLPNRSFSRDFYSR